MEINIKKKNIHVHAFIHINSYFFDVLTDPIKECEN